MGTSPPELGSETKMKGGLWYDYINKSAKVGYP